MFLLYPVLFHQAFLCHLQVHSQQLSGAVFCRPWIEYHQTIGKLNGFRKPTFHIKYHCFLSNQNCQTLKVSSTLAKTILSWHVHAYTALLIVLRS